MRFKDNRQIIEHFETYDGICIFETWATTGDDICNCFDAFDCQHIPAVRYKRFRRPSSGVAVYYKTNLRTHFKRIYNSFKFGLVFEMSRILLGSTNGIIMIAIYLPTLKETSRMCPRRDVVCYLLSGYNDKNSRV